MNRSPGPKPFPVPLQDMALYTEISRNHPLYMGVFSARQARNVKKLKILRLGSGWESAKFLDKFDHFPIASNPSIC
jgi:hypothetical protein